MTPEFNPCGNGRAGARPPPNSGGGKAAALPILASGALLFELCRDEGAP